MDWRCAMLQMFGSDSLCVSMTQWALAVLLSIIGCCRLSMRERTISSVMLSAKKNGVVSDAAIQF
jgi:hypothetical protein